MIFLVWQILGNIHDANDVKFLTIIPIMLAFLGYCSLPRTHDRIEIIYDIIVSALFLGSVALFAYALISNIVRYFKRRFTTF